MKLLDIASGTCDLAIAFAHRTNAENITATDINYEMLSYGRQRLEQLGPVSYTHLVRVLAWLYWRENNGPLPWALFDGRASV